MIKTLVVAATLFLVQIQNFAHASEDGPKVALITGASRGIGRALAENLHCFRDRKNGDQPYGDSKAI